MAKKQTVCKREYRNSDGTKSRSARADTEALSLQFVNGSEIVITLDNIHKDCQHAALFHGLSQKVGDAWNDVKGDAEKAFENATSMLERMAEGTWVEKAESAGPTTNMLVDAIVRAKIAGGEKAKDVDTLERRAAIAAKLKGETPQATKEARAGALANPQIAAAYEAIKAEKAAERAAKKAAAAEGAETTGLDAF